MTFRSDGAVCEMGRAIATSDALLNDVEPFSVFMLLLDVMGCPWQSEFG